MNEEVAEPDQQHQMADKVQEALTLVRALGASAQEDFLAQLIDSISLNVYRTVKEKLEKHDRTKKSFINDELPTELLIEIYSYLEPGAPILHQLVCKDWQSRLMHDDVLRAQCIHWLDYAPMPLVCELNDEPPDTITLKKLEAMHRFRTGNPKWKLTFPIEDHLTAQVQMLGNNFLLGPNRYGYIRLVNVHTGEMWGHCITDDSDRNNSSLIWQCSHRAFFHVEVHDEEETNYYCVLDFDSKDTSTLCCPSDQELCFVGFERYAAILHGQDIIRQGAEVILWQWKTQQTTKLKLPALAGLLPEDFIERSLLDHHIKVNMNDDETALTLILLANFQEDWQHVEQCVILLFRLEFDEATVNPSTRFVSFDVDVKVATRADRTDRSDANDVELPVQYLGWAKNATYFLEYKGESRFRDSEEYLSIDSESAEFSIVKVKGTSDVYNREAFVWKGVTYSVPHGALSSARLIQNLTSDDPVYTLFHDSDIVPGFVPPGSDGGTWWNGNLFDPVIVGDPRVLFFGSYDKVTIAAFDPDINIPHRFLTDDWNASFDDGLDPASRGESWQGGWGQDEGELEDDEENGENEEDGEDGEDGDDGEDGEDVPNDEVADEPNDTGDLTSGYSEWGW